MFKSKPKRVISDSDSKLRQDPLPQLSEREIDILRFDRNINTGFMGMYKNYFALTLSLMSFLGGGSFVYKMIRDEKYDLENIFWALSFATACVWNGILMLWQYNAMHKRDLENAEKAYNGMKILLGVYIAILFPIQFLLGIDQESLVIMAGMAFAYISGIFVNSQKVVELLRKRAQLVDHGYYS